MRVLVTGASGFVGSAVVSALNKRDHEVFAISSRDIADGTSAPDARTPDVTWLNVDLLNPDGDFPAIQSARAECLIHCAWDATPGEYWTSSKNLQWVQASINLAESFQRGGGTRMVVAGTSAEYCWLGKEPLNEKETPLKPITLYGKSKNDLRKLLESSANETDMSVAWARLFCPFGRNENPARIVPRLIRRLQTTEKMPFDSGSLVRDFLSVDDLGEAFAALAESSLCGPINLASGRATSIRELVTLIASELNAEHKVQFDVEDDPENQPARIVADVARLANELDWQPTATLEQRIAETCEWWRAN